MGSINPTERIEIRITRADFDQLSKEDKKFTEQTGDVSMLYALVAKQHGYRIVEYPPRGGFSKVFTVVKI